MAKEIVAWCDQCMTENTRSPAETVVLGVDGREQSVDLCEQHRKEIIEPVVDLFRDYGVIMDKGTSQGKGATAARVLAAAESGQRYGRRPSGPRVHQCLWCPLTYANPSSLTKHLANVHGVHGIEAAFGRVCPLCGGSYDALGGHVVNVHKDEAPNVSQAFQLAQQQGDPHGVVAAQLKVATK